MSNFFHHYKTYSDPTESPRSYHWWTALGTISALLGRKCFVQQGIFNVYPQLYIVLVGSAGLRKTTAFDIGRKLLEELEGIPVAPSTASKEALLDFMSKEGKRNYVLHGRQCSFNQTSAFASELSTFMGGKHLNIEIVKFLTDIWDSNTYIEMTRKGGKVVIQDPYFTLLACCPRDFLESQLSSDIITGGFARRTIFDYQDKLFQLIPNPHLTDVQVEARKKLILEAKRISQMAGVFKLTPKAQILHDTEYKRIMNQIESYNEKVQNYFSSRHVLAFKLYMCISAGLHSSFTITDDIVRMAHQALGYSEERLDEVFRAVGRNILKPIADKILDKVYEEEKIGEKKLFANFFSEGMVTFEEYKSITESLLQAGLIKAEMNTAGSLDYLPTGKQKTPASTDMLAEVCRLNTQEAKSAPITRTLVESLLDSIKSNQIEIEDENP